MKNSGIILLLLKIGSIILPIIKSAKFLKFGLAGVSLTAYSYMFTLEFAIIILVSIVFHEFGHLQAMKHLGMNTKGIYLIPFFGGAAVADEDFKDRYSETFVALAGPLYGFALAIMFLIIYFLTDSLLILGIVSFMALINLFNLFPINPLDGGRVLKSIAFSFSNYFGIIIMILGILFASYLIYIYHIWLLFFIIIIGSIELFFETISFKYQENKARNKDSELLTIKELDLIKKKMSTKEIIIMSFLYLFLTVSFISMIYFSSSVEGADLVLNILKEEGI